MVQSPPELSLGLVNETGVGTGEPVIDVSSDWSTLVDHAVERGYCDLTAIDLSATALAMVRGRIESPPRPVSPRRAGDEREAVRVTTRPGASQTGHTLNR